MMKLVLVSAFFPPGQGGIETTLATLARLPGANITVIAPLQREAEMWDRQQPFRVIRTPFFSPKRWPSWFPLTRVIRRTVELVRPDHLVFGHYAPYVMIGRSIHRRWNIPYSVYCHGLDALAYTATRAHRLLLRSNLRSAQTVFVNSRWTARQLSDYVAGHLVAVLHPPVPDNHCAPTPLPQGPTLFSLGRWNVIKGYDVGIRAVALLKNSFPNIRYVLQGAGDEEPLYRRLIAELGLTEQVTLITPGDQQKKCTSLSEASIVVQPSRSILHPTFVQEESFGIAALEAAAAGRPVVSSRVGGVPEAIEDGVTGRLVPPDDPVALSDAIASLWRNPRELQRLSQNAAIRVAQQSSSDKFYARVDQILNPQQLPKISVCIPAWNAERTLAATLGSLLDQTYRNIEWIVVDDGSTDRTAAIARTDERVKYVAGAHRGAAAARNRAAETATGDLLYFSDADCIHRPDALQTLYLSLLRHPEASYAYSAFRLGWKTFRLRPYDPDALRKRNYISTRALVWKRDFPGYDESIRRLQDWDLWLRMAEQGKRGVWVDDILYRSVPSARSMSSGWFPKFLYRFPRLADRLSRGAGLSLREAEELIRKKHGLKYATPSDRAFMFVCTRCQAPLTRGDNAWRCSECGHAYQIRAGIPQLLHPAYLSGFKQQEIETHDHRVHDAASGERDAYFHRHAKQPLHALPRGSLILEVACGERPDMFELAQDGQYILASDISSARVGKARAWCERQGVSATQFCVADAEHLPLANDSVDAVYVAASFHHFPNPQRALHEFHRVVKPGGLVVVALEPQRWPYRTVFRWLRPVRNILRKRHAEPHSAGDDTTEGFTDLQLRALFRNEGLKIIEVRRVKCLSEFADQATRLLGKILHREWDDAPRMLSRPLEHIDQILEHLPLTRSLFWHWTVISRA